MIYTTNWIERLQKDFRRVTRMRGALPDETSVLVLMGKTAMDKESYARVIPRIREDKIPGHSEIWTPTINRRESLPSTETLPLTDTDVE